MHPGAFVCVMESKAQVAAMSDRHNAELIRTRDVDEGGRMQGRRWQVSYVSVQRLHVRVEVPMGVLQLIGANSAR